MPRDALHLLSFSPHEQRYTFSNGSPNLSSEITTSSHAWEEWLNTVSSFAFEDRSGGHYTIRKERLRRGDAYWYAYRSIQGRTKKRYLGRTSDLSLGRLEEISALFPQELRAAPNRRTVDVVPLLETKLHPPQISTLLVERARLLARLDSSLAHKVTLLLAPAGFGKTTLVNQWLATHSALPTPLKLAWISLDHGDNDPLRFWRYVITASQRLLGQEQKATAALTSLTVSIHPPFDSPPIDMALTHLLNALANSSSGGLLVLDDYHVISEPRIHGMLTFFIDYLPASMHVLLISRSEPDLPLLRWRARGDLSELYGADLRFSLEEMTTFLHHALPISLSEETLTRLDSSLEGWAAGLRLLSLTFSRWHTSRAIEQALLLLGERTGLSKRQAGSTVPPHHALLDYFVTEILETQPEPMQHFLLQTSVLGRLCAPLCDTVTASENSARQLAGIERSGLFLEALEGPGGWYRYHALFAEAMRREASQRLGEEVLQALSLRASYWYEQEALLTEAIEAAWLAQDMERMAKLIEQINEKSFYEPQTILQWLEQLPETVLHAHPQLCLIFATELRFPIELRFPQKAVSLSEIASISEADRSRSEALLQMAEECWQRSGERAWIGAIWAHRALSSLVDQKPFSSMVTAAQQALAFLPQKEAQDGRLQMYRSSCLLFVGTEKLRQGRVGEARQMLQQAREDNVPPGNRFLAVDIHLMSGRIHLIQGELQQAQRNFRQVLSEASELNDEEIIADSLLELAWLAFEWNDLEKAEQQVHAALEVVQRIRYQKQDLCDRVELQLALLQHARGETAVALERLTAIQSHLPRAWTRYGFWLASRHHDWQGRLRIATGNAQESLDAQSQSNTDISITEQLEEETLRGRLWLAQGKARDALQQFAHLLPLAQEQLHQYAALELQVLLALAHAACKQEQQTQYWLRQTLLQTLHEGYIRLFLNEGKPVVLLLRSLLPGLQHDPMLRSYTQTILRAAAQETGSPHTSQNPSKRESRGGGSLFEPLSSQEERVLRLLVAGWSNQDIARELIVSVNTVKYHMKHLYQKLGVSNRLQASEAAHHLKLDRPL